ncbi:expressed protein [Echinococcus multilocularis]|uniref:Expressed protein n=1 Tax=Echinococcus multilocularis TaxID=6211 RepID=A0A087VY11_ECHMU|nr:expressed protein [Echinococcus multilocularis]
MQHTSIMTSTKSRWCYTNKSTKYTAKTKENRQLRSVGQFLSSRPLLTHRSVALFSPNSCPHQNTSTQTYIKHAKLPFLTSQRYAPNVNVISSSTTPIIMNTTLHYTTLRYTDHLHL